MTRPLDTVPRLPLQSYRPVVIVIELGTRSLTASYENAQDAIDLEDEPPSRSKVPMPEKSIIMVQDDYGSQSSGKLTRASPMIFNCGNHEKILAVCGMRYVRFSVTFTGVAMT